MEDVPGLLRPLPEGVLRFWPIDERVGKVSNDGPELIERHEEPEPELALGASADPNPTLPL